MKLKNLNNSWFFQSPNIFFRVFAQIFIKGDAIIILPFFLIIILISLIKLKISLIIYFIYLSIRSLGEIIYWLLQQFHQTNYRPFDFGFKNLNNKAIYILYQCFAIVSAVIGISLTILTILYL